MAPYEHGQLAGSIAAELAQMLAPGGAVAGKIGKAAKLGALDKKTKKLREALEKLAKDTPDAHNNWLKEWASGGGYAGSGKALPPGPQVKGQWSTSKYKHGGEMSGIEHVMYKHGAATAFKISKYLPGTKARDVKSYTDEALRHGKAIPNGPNKYKIEYDVGKIIGKDIDGTLTSKIRVFIRDDVIQTVFPY